MTKPNAVVSVPNASPRKPTEEECWDQFELVAREFVYCFDNPEDLRDDVAPSVTSTNSPRPAAS